MPTMLVRLQIAECIGYFIQLISGLIGQVEKIDNFFPFENFILGLISLEHSLAPTDLKRLNKHHLQKYLWF